MVTALIVAVVVLLAACVVLAAGWRATAHELGNATRRAAAAEDLANAFLSMLRKAGVVNTVDTCQRTQGSKR